MNDKYTKLVETLPKESEELWFEYNLEVNKIIQENQQLKIQISAREEEYRKLEDNWNKLKEYIKQEPTSDFYNDKLPFEVIMVKIITKMQELERGVSDVED